MGHAHQLSDILAWSHFGAHQTSETPPDEVWVLHGILGSRQNWARFARLLSEANPQLSILTIDLRCHGESPEFSGPHTVNACAQDLQELARSRGEPSVIIGHSFGGKVALSYATKHPRNLRTVWTLDSPLDAAPQAGQSEVLRLIETCAQAPLPLHSRAMLIEWFVEQDFAMGVAQWMTTNLKRSPEGLVWKFNLEGMRALITDYWRIDGWALLQEISQSVSLNLLRAERGMRWTEEATARVARVAPQANAPLLVNSGHWVHIDQLDALIEMIGDLNA
jgi:esterase